MSRHMENIIGDNKVDNLDKTGEVKEGDKIEKCSESNDNGVSEKQSLNEKLDKFKENAKEAATKTLATVGILAAVASTGLGYRGVEAKTQKVENNGDGTSVVRVVDLPQKDKIQDFEDYKNNTRKIAKTIKGAMTLKGELKEKNKNLVDPQFKEVPKF